MCRKLVFLALVLSIASISYGVQFGSRGIVAGNWESGTLEGWGAAWEDSPTIAVGAAGGPGNTVGTRALNVSGVDGGYWILQWNADASQLASIKGLVYEGKALTLTFDVTMLAADWPTQPWTRVADKVAFNSNSATGWKEWTTTTAVSRQDGLVTSTDWGAWAGNAYKTYKLVLAPGAYNTTGATNFQVNIAFQGPGAGTETQYFYIDNVGIPEPATMALLGLGAMALIRRKR